MPATITLTAPATIDGVSELEVQLAGLKRQWGLAPAPVAAPAAIVEHEAVKLYRRTAENSRSREVLEVLPGAKENALTPTELAQLMKPGKNGKPLSRGSVRAAIRVVQRVTTKALKEGAISGDVLKIDFGRYAEQGAGRYYIESEARASLDRHLAA